jgi:hypothetical protein
MMNNIMHSSLCPGTNLSSQRKQKPFAWQSAISASDNFLVGIGQLDAAKAAVADELAGVVADGLDHDLADDQGADLDAEAASRASVVDRCS